VRSGACTGWRAWRLGPDGLRSVLHDDVWLPGRPLDASCREAHAAPDVLCGCGIHAARDVREARRYLVGRDDRPRVLGRVSLWGLVVEGEKGWRAERGYPERLWAPDDEIAALLAAYGVPVSVGSAPVA
jgi:hypothetical protein